MASFKFIHVKSQLAPLDQGARKRQIAQVRRHAASVSHKNKRDSARAAQSRPLSDQSERLPAEFEPLTAVISNEPSREDEIDGSKDLAPTFYKHGSTSSSPPACGHIDPGFGFFRTEVYQLIPHENNIDTLRTLDFCE